MRYFLALSFLLASVCFGAKLHYDLYKKDSNSSQNSPVLLIIGGIHGNEPGSYFAPIIFTRYYTITKGAVWVIPNLNRDSIIAFNRGIYGDMNRKFSKIDSSDQDYKIVEEIKGLITQKRIAVVLNLHDGHGYYRSKYVNTLMNPQAWGQATIIDQPKLDGVQYGNLADIAKRVTSKTSVVAIDENHEFNVKDTQTKEKDEQMRQSLTYFSIKANKPAFGVETSKNIDSLSLKVVYQLKAIEEFMNIIGIEYKRDFELTQKNIEKLVADRGNLVLSNKIVIPLNDIKQRLVNIPIDGNISFSSDNPGVTVAKDGNSASIYNGYRKISTFSFEKSKNNQSIKDIKATIDGNAQNIALGSVVGVKKDVVFESSDFKFKLFNTNVLSSKLEIKTSDKKLSIDNNGKVFLVLVYDKTGIFCGSVAVRLN